MAIKRVSPLSFISILFVLLLLGGCSTSTESTNPTGSAKTTVFGQIVDEAGVGLSGASVTAYSTTVTTDANGFFRIENIAAPSARVVASASKTGYINSSKAVTPVNSGFAQVQMILLRDVVYNSNTSAASASFSDGGSVQLPSNGITSDGQPYSGPIQIHARHLDPGSLNFYQAFPGDMAARRFDGSAVNLYSYGVLDIELTTPTGKMLQLAPSTFATLTFPISPTQTDAPDTIPLWYFSTTDGLWIEEGSAVKSGTKYIGTVSHFSPHNIDKVVHPAFVFGQVKCGDSALVGVPVQVGQQVVYTDYRGVFKTFIESHRTIDVTVAYNLRGLTSNTVTITDPQNNIDYDAWLTVDNCTSVTGNLVDCDNQLTSGIVTATWGTNGFAAFPVSGRFQLNLPANVPVTLTTPGGVTKIVGPLIAGQSVPIDNLSDCPGGGMTTATLSVNGVQTPWDSMQCLQYPTGHGAFVDTAIITLFFKHGTGNVLGKLTLEWVGTQVGIYPLTSTTVTHLVGAATYTDNSRYPGSFFTTDNTKAWTGSVSVTISNSGSFAGTFDVNAGDGKGLTTDVLHLAGQFSCRKH
jgi:hypothetical protein